MLLALGVGVLAGCSAKRPGSRSIGGFGVACASAGVAVAVAALVLVPPTITSRLSLGSFAFIALGAIGAVTAYGRETLLNRVASRSAEGAKMTARLLVCVALTFWIITPLVIRLIGESATLILLGLSLLALGGTLIIHEPTYSPRTRRARLGAVFGSIGATIVVSSFPSSPWRRNPESPAPTLRIATRAELADTSGKNDPSRHRYRR